MSKITRTVKKPNSNTRWFHEIVSPLFLDYIEENYVKTGQLTKTVTYDETGNVQTSVFLWADEESFQQFKENPMTIIIHDQRRSHEINNHFEIIFQDSEIL